MVEAPESFVHPPSSASSRPRVLMARRMEWENMGKHGKTRDINDDVCTVWRFPEMGGPLNHPFDFQIFHSKPSSYWGTPIYGNLHMEMMMGMMGMGFSWFSDSAADFFTSSLWHTFRAMESHGMEGFLNDWQWVNSWSFIWVNGSRYVKIVKW